jgi:hypothetical protein
MPITIGWAGADAGLALTPAQIGFGARDDLEVSGWVRASTQADLRLVRHQLLGLVEDTARPHPVTDTADPGIDGWYQVRAVDVPTSGDYLIALALPWRLKLRRLAAGPATLELGRLGIARRGLTATAHDVTAFDLSADGGWRVSTNAFSSSTASTAAVAASDGSTLTLMRAVAVDIVSGVNGDNSPWFFGMPPGRMLRGACRLSTSADGTTWRTVIGTPFDQTRWRIENGVCRITGSTSGTEDIIVEAWDPDSGGAWQGRAWSFGLDATFGWRNSYGLRGVQVLRNTTERLTLRLTYGGTEPLQAEVSLRRGARWAIVRLIRPAGHATQRLRIKPAAYVAAFEVAFASDTSNALREIANNAAGNRAWCAGLVTAEAATVADGELRSTIATGDTLHRSMVTVVGTEVGGTGSAAPERAIDQWRMSAWAATHTLRVVTST